MNDKTLERIATALEGILAEKKRGNDFTVAKFGPAGGDAPAAETPAAGKGTKGKGSKAAEEKAPEPDPEPEKPKNIEGVETPVAELLEITGDDATSDDCRAAYRSLTTAVKAGPAGEVFNLFKERFGKQKLDDMEPAERGALLAGFNKVIADKEASEM